MEHKIENFYLSQKEPTKSCLLFLRDYILQLDSNMIECWKYGSVFFTLNKKMFCYFWFDKKQSNKPYIGMAKGTEMHHPALEQGTRKKMKILRIEPEIDLPIETLDEVFAEALSLYPLKGKN